MTESNNRREVRLQYSVADALVLAGGRVEHGAIDYAPFVVSAIIPPSHLNRLSL